MRRAEANEGEGSSADLCQSELLSRVGDTHRERVAHTLGIAAAASAHEITSLFSDEAYLDAQLDGLSRAARELLCAGAFETEGIALRLDSSAIEHGYLPDSRAERARGEIAKALERRALLFAFADDRHLVYRVPADLRLPLRRLLAARLARGTRHAGARRWLDLAGQDLRDAAALWMELARKPVPIGWNGKFLKTSRPRMLAAMPALELADPGGGLTARRLDLALALLRDWGCAWPQADWDDPYLTKAHLAAVGDLAGALGDDDFTLGRFPWELGYWHFDNVLAARVLAEPLAGRSVGLRGFGIAMQTLLVAVECRLTRHQTLPVHVALSGLLPALLRGEAQLGLNGDRAVAVRFISSEPARSAARRELMERCRAVAPAEDTSAGPSEEDDLESEDRWDSFANSVRREWCTRELDPFAHWSKYPHFDSRAFPATLLSTLDRPLADAVPSREARRAEREAEGKTALASAGNRVASLA